MSRRLLASVGVVGLFLAAVWLAPVRVTAQTANTTAKSQEPAKPLALPKPAVPAKSGWRMPRTPDGQPDLQGFWTNTTYVPLERPKDVTKEFFTKEEMVERIKQLAAAESEQTEPGTIPDVHYDFTQFGLDRSQGPLAFNLRSSLIVDPRDGRIPPLTAEGQKRAAERAEERRRMGGPVDAASTGI